MNRPDLSQANAINLDGSFQQRFERLGSLAKQPIAEELFFESVLQSISLDVKLTGAAIWRHRGDHLHPIVSLLDGGNRELVVTGLGWIAEHPRDCFHGTTSQGHISLISVVEVLSQESPPTSLAGITAADQPPSRPSANEGRTDDHKADTKQRFVFQLTLDAANSPPRPPTQSNSEQPSSPDQTAPTPAPVSPTQNAQNAEQLLQAYGLLIEDRVRHQTLMQLRQSLQSRRQVSRYLQTISESLELQRTGRNIVAATVSATGCQRASITVSDWRGNRHPQHVLAVSGVATLDHRSPPVRKLKDLASAVALSRQTLVHDGSSQDRPPQLETPLDQYIDQAHLAYLFAVPLLLGTETADPDAVSKPTYQSLAHEPHSVVGVLLLEFQDPGLLAHAIPLIEELAVPTANTLAHAAIHTRLPFRRVGSMIRRVCLGSPLAGIPLSAWLAGLIVASSFALAWIPAELKIKCTGELQPASVHRVFAPRDGNIRDVSVRHGQSVSADTLLIEMESPQLDLEIQRIEGAIDSTRQELQAAEAARRRNTSDRFGGRPDPGQRSSRGGTSQNGGSSLAAEETRLKSVLNSYQQQLRLLLAQRGRLTMKSPVSGTVLTWQVEQTLRRRPVRRGQQLLRIAPADAPWRLELDLPDRSAGKVHAAVASNLVSDAPPPVVEYVITNQPQQRFLGRIEQLAEITTMSDDGPIVEIIVQLDEAPPPSVRAGTQVQAEIQCGPASLGYVWFHELWDAIQLHLFF